MTPPRVLLRPPLADDCDAFLRAARGSRSLHHPWIHPPLNREDFAPYLDRYQRPAPESISRLVCLADGGSLVGVINLNHIIRGYFQNAFLGFYAFLPHAGRGLMLEGLHLVIAEAFDQLDLHRLEANVQPANQRSLKLVRRAGFRKEGYSRHYLRIAGEWCDHERWALLREDVEAGRQPA